MLCRQPAAPAGHGAVQRPHEDDVDHRLPGVRRELFGARDEVPGRVINEYVERPVIPDGLDHLFDAVEIANVARERVDWPRRLQLIGGGVQYFLPASADVDGGPEFEEAAGHAFAGSGAAAGDEDALVQQEVLVEHNLRSPAGSGWPLEMTDYMECPWLQLGMAGVVLLLLGAQTESPAQSASQWRTLASGMDIRVVQSRKQTLVGDSKITVLRIDPGRWELELMGVFQTGESGGHTAREWSKKQKYAAAINAGMFQTDGKTHLGYLRSGDRVYNGRLNSYQSVMAFDPRQPGKVAAFRIFDLDSPG